MKFSDMTSTWMKIFPFLQYRLASPPQYPWGVVVELILKLSDWLTANQTLRHFSSDDSFFELIGLDAHTYGRQRTLLH